MKKPAGIFLLALLMINSHAQQDPKAKTILDALSNRTKSFSSIRAQFTIGLENTRDNIKEEFSGSIMMKGEKYKLSAMGTETFFDGKTIWTYLPEVNEVYISNPEDKEESILGDPSRLFTIYQEDFKYRFIADVTRGGIKLAEIDLYPIDLNQQFSRIKLFIDKDKLQIDSAMVFGKDGNTYVFVVNTFQTNITVRDSDFVFDPSAHKGIEIIDIRF